MKPLCAVFGQCGGCQYQDMPYAEELTLKQKYLENLFADAGICGVISEIVSSPKEYHYRSRLDMKFLRTRDGRMFMGFSPKEGKWMIEVNSCPIAMPAISDYLPQLKIQAAQKVTPKHRNANLVIKTGDDGRVFWGGVGKRSLKMLPENYFWTDIEGKKIFYSLDTFFQANLSILPVLISQIRSLNILNKDTHFYDLYGGVGLFGIAFYDMVSRVTLIEENVHSIAIAKHNVSYHGFDHFDIIEGRVESVYPQFLERKTSYPQVAMIDPPRQGLHESVALALAETKNISSVMYLSCDPQSLVRDLKFFKDRGWKIRTIIPFDFFPRTRHIETFVHLKPGDSHD